MNRSVNRNTDRDVNRNTSRNANGNMKGMAGTEQAEFDRELTARGMAVCGVAGVLEETVVFLVLGIRVAAAPLPVTAFLWFLFALLTAAAMIAADSFAERLSEMLHWSAAQRASQRILPYRQAGAEAGIAAHMDKNGRWKNAA